MENNPLFNIFQEVDVASGKADKNVLQEKASEAFLKAINEAAGREYKDNDEALKGVKETFSFIGQMGQLKEKAAKWDEAEAKKTDKQRQNENRSEEFDRLERLEFLYHNPDAKYVPGVEKDIQVIARGKGVSMDEAYKDSVFAKQVETEKKSQEAAHPSVVEGGRLPEGLKGITLEDFKQLPFDKQTEIVKQLPAFKKPL